MDQSMIVNRDVATVFDTYPADVRAKLERLRQLIVETAAETEGVGEVEETLKWGQPSYLTPSGSGSTIRIDAVKGQAGHYAMYVNCRTSLVESYKQKYAETFQFEGTRAIIFDAHDELPVEAVKDCIALALTYHRR